jgi:hypothetical protein
MNEAECRTRLQELITEVTTLPSEQRNRLEPLLEQTRAMHETISANRREIEDVLSSWRLELKYLLFALEATHRERTENQE